MDEFCGNKDSQLKRCACSSRVNEFDDVKKQLTQVDEQMLEFSQRLLTVNMDREDAAALFQATEGELAFNKKDTSDSKQMLDEIAKKLNTSFDDSNFDQRLNSISLSLNADAAFDTVDSLAGASTTLKTGTALYNSALPVCREMAAEVCTPDELVIATSGYQMAIEQDCNTVFKTYQTQVDQARERVRENSALLDMSRLDIHQKRNSDDILTCKSKMLDMLTDSSVCGENLGKCLDTTGQYIDPTTGQAFLTTNLVNLGKLITRPTDGISWTKIPGNGIFVSYLNSKKKFLAPAMEKCQDISDYVWDEFMEDALAQIKLAQDAKLEEVRQSCTTLTTQCLSDAKDSIEEFDARALSTFGVWADKTVNAMCADIKIACSALLTVPDSDADSDWNTGIGDIETNITYDTILTTCREVGRACIIQTCKSTSGNFGLCENIDSSVNRKSIINRTACWDEVYNCIADAGMGKLKDIYTLEQGSTAASAFYDTMYADATATPAYIMPPYDWCTKVDLECGTDAARNDTDACRLCRMTEQIWGNCEAAPTTELVDKTDTNRIIIPSDGTSTLLAWFAQNTGTDDAVDSCRDTSCGAGFTAQVINGTLTCVSTEGITQGDNQMCIDPFKSFRTPAGSGNCCKSTDGNTPGSMDTVGSQCCPTNNVRTIDGVGKICLPASAATNEHTLSFSVANQTEYYALSTDYHLICVGGTTSAGADSGTDGDYPSGNQVRCNGKFMFVTPDGKLIAPSSNMTASAPSMTFLDSKGNIRYELQYTTDGWKWVPDDASAPVYPASASDQARISY